IKDFDPVLNKKHLLECMKWYLSSSDSISEKDDVADLFHWLNIKEKDGLRNDRILVESLYLLCNLDDVHPMLRYLKLKTKFKSSPRLLLAYNIAIANLKCNFITMCKLSKQLCPLAHCAFSLYLPILQRRALQVMSHAYNSKSLTVPVPVLRQWLRYENDAITIAACTHYGLQAQSNAIRLCKADFKEDVAILPPKKLLLHDEKLDLTANHVFTYKT
ncbi:uncharacterized protein LOC113239592, partial [Hyposmocoma kahamanoa]|uniref:uncharacterized protein LOC113239592 n=1 Tax=Hyposmocoma kahamanoa TaxID=1477025 RepID=UPI000E6D64E6